MFDVSRGINLDICVSLSKILDIFILLIIVFLFFFFAADDIHCPLRLLLQCYKTTEGPCLLTETLTTSLLVVFVGFYL